MQIGIDTVALEDGYAKLQQYHDEFVQLIAAMNGVIVDEIDPAWEGTANTEYLEQWSEVKDHMNTEVSDVLDTIGVQIDQVREAMEQLDDNMRAQLAQRG